MSGQAVPVMPGGRLFFGGDVGEVMELDGLQVTVRNERTDGFSVIPLGRRRIVIAEQRAPGDAARELNTTLAHIRFALEHVATEPQVLDRQSLTAGRLAPARTSPPDLHQRLPAPRIHRRR
ncbi:hypothetical protein [Streptomyces sp. S.PB5]|uniref:hypothetical protein n=1 Tax=Streptomyces sp. S.PB5 TaxID=3020844 RepID=UPI0025B1F1AD|nr:hypothetical protein [Streptomyces sp. S.PB5]MDN3029230.1 hypothetical protein [Streptomyces sp. S.PB5]